MAGIIGTRLERYTLVHAAHEFVLTALPFRHRCSREALARFVDTARGCKLPAPELDAVLLTLLSVLDPHTRGRLPSLVDRYLADRRLESDAVQRFHTCVDDVIRFRGVGRREVQEAIAIVESRFDDARLTQAGVASDVGLMPQELSSLFRAQTGLTFAEYVRDVRLDRAARLLTTGHASIKEIWSAVGYNDASNFNHQFRARFAETPREYRARAIGCRTSPAMPSPTIAGDDDGRRREARPAIMIVDDNPVTLETLSRHFRESGYEVARAATGNGALAEAERRTLDGIILDHHLPDMDGLNCLERLRQRDRRNGPTVLLFTADWDVADRSEDLARLGATFASKLCDLDEIERLVASIVAMRATFGPACAEPV